MNKFLSQEQVKQYESEGIVFPLPVLSAHEISKIRSIFEELESKLGGKQKYMGWPHHMCFRWAYDLASHPAVLDAIEDILGPDILAPGALRQLHWHPNAAELDFVVTGEAEFGV